MADFLKPASMRQIVLWILALAACGCAGPDRSGEANRQTQAAALACDAQYPRVRLDLSNGRATCLNEAENILLAAGYPYPDLIYRRQAERLFLARRLQRGEITRETSDIEWKLFQADFARSFSERAQSDENARAARAAALLPALSGMQLANHPVQLTPYVVPGNPTISTNCYTSGPMTNCQSH